MPPPPCPLSALTLGKAPHAVAGLVHSEVAALAESYVVGLHRAAVAANRAEGLVLLAPGKRVNEVWSYGWCE